MGTTIPQIKFVFDRKKKASEDKEGIIEIRISYDYKKKYISTGIKVLPSQWRKEMVVNHPDSRNLNKVLNRKLGEIREELLEMMEDGVINISSISDNIQKKNEPKISFLDFCKKRAEIRKYGKSKDNQERYDRFLRFFQTWNVIKAFEDITASNIILLDKHLGKMKENSKWYNYHRFLNSFIIDAVNEGLLKRNPYKEINIGKGNSEGIDKYLTPEEFERIKNVELPTDSLRRVRDIFVFQTYTCLSYSDLRDFDVSNIQEVNGMKVYTGNRNKTGERFTIPLLQPALHLIYIYKGKLPVISNVKYNYYLKIIAQAAGIDKPVSTHWARHTGATMLLNEGIDMQIVSKICGHSSIRMTEKIYAKLLDETVVNAIKKLNK